MLPAAFHPAFIPVNGVPDGILVQISVNTLDDAPVFQCNHLYAELTAFAAHTLLNRVISCCLWNGLIASSYCPSISVGSMPKRPVYCP